MRIDELISAIFVHVAFVLGVALLITISRNSQRSMLRTAFIMTSVCQLIWNLGTMLELDYRLIFNETVESTVSILLIDICYFSICFAPITVLLLGRAIAQPGWRPAIRHALILAVPVFSFIMVCTNPLHQLFFRHFSLYSSEAVYGPYYYFHSLYSYACILVGVGYMAVFAVRSSGIFSRQAILVLTGILVPSVGNVLYSFGLVDLSFSINACLFTVTVLCFAVAFFKYRFIRMTPEAMRQVVDMISDGYLLADESLHIVDHNSTLLRLLPGAAPITAEMTVPDFFRRGQLERPVEEYMTLYRRAIANRAPVELEITVPGPRHFSMKMSPVFRKNIYTGSIVILRDITDVKQAAETILHSHTTRLEQKQERERFLDMVDTLRGVVSTKDPYTRGHSDRVCYYAVKTGQALGLSKRQLQILDIGSKFHDIGKISTPDSILMKNGKLTETEFLQIKNHPQDGVLILSVMNMFRDILPIVRSHHERFDGTGYPQGLAGEEIPLLARIVTVADAFDAMTSQRAYRGRRSWQEALQQLEKGAGTQFDPLLVSVFLRYVQDNVAQIQADMAELHGQE